MYRGDRDVLKNQQSQSWTNTPRDPAEITAAWLEEGREFDQVIANLFVLAGLPVPPEILASVALAPSETATLVRRGTTTRRFTTEW